MTTQSTATIIHHPEDKQTRTTVTFGMNAHQEGEPSEWGSLQIQLETTDGNGGTHLTNLTHILVGADWRAKAAGIRQAFRSSTLRR